MHKAVIFDFDGVLCDSFEFHVDKLQKFTGKKICRDEYRDIHDGNFFEKCPADLSKIDWEDYRKYVYDDQILLALNKGVHDTLNELSKKNTLFVISSAAENNIKGVLKQNDVLHFFKDILGHDAHTSKEEKFKLLFKKYSLSPKDCVFVTDTLGDILEANEVGVKSIAVDFGFHDRERLKKGNPVAIVSSFEEIASVIKKS